MSKKTIILGIFLIIWMGVIFYMSSDNADDSGNKSSNVVGFIVSGYDKIVGSNEETINYHKSKEFLNQANHIFRKLCHFTEYLILAIFSFLFIESFDKLKLLLCLLYSFIFSVIYAISDEIHQTFIDGRAGQITDVLIDTSGIILGLFVICFITKKYKLNKKIQ